jgi:hypothetical protein
VTARRELEGQLELDLELPALRMCVLCQRRRAHPGNELCWLCLRSLDLCGCVPPDTQDRSVAP